MEGQEYEKSKPVEFQGKLNLRKFSKIPTFIVDYHNDVLEFIYRCIGSRHLKLQNTLIHFDSHPDLVIPSIRPSDVYEKDVLLSELSIENWIMPMCFSGNVNKIIWIKNSWCEQIAEGKYNFVIGQKDESIHVSCPLNYFVSEGKYCESDEMENKRDIELEVFNLDTAVVATNCLSLIDDESHVILDIDLDFFSTANPFLGIFQEVNCYQRLEKIFGFESSPTVAETATKRKAQLENLKLVFDHLEKNRKIENFPANLIPEHILLEIKTLAEDLELNYKHNDIDWEILYDAGCTADSGGLPHHISTTQELEKYFENFRKFLESMSVVPVAITIARSAEDGYCPRNQVDYIQQRVLSILMDQFPGKINSEPIKRYLNEEWNIMDL